MSNQDQRRPEIGMEVSDEPGHFIGKEESVACDHFVVETGFIFPRAQQFPVARILNMNENEVRLRTSPESAPVAREVAEATQSPDWDDERS